MRAFVYGEINRLGEVHAVPVQGDPRERLTLVLRAVTAQSEAILSCENVDGIPE